MSHSYGAGGLHVPRVEDRVRFDGVTSFAKDILVYDSGVTWAQALIDQATAIDNWQPSVEQTDGRGDERTERRHSSQLSINRENHICLGRYQDAIYRLFDEVLGLYRRRNPFFRFDGLNSIDLLRYEAGGTYGLHVDCANPKQVPRLLSLLFYLNCDFTGGELHFPRQNKIIRPRTGLVVAFPSIGTHPHEARPVKTGKRYVAVTWAH